MRAKHAVTSSILRNVAAWLALLASLCIVLLLLNGAAFSAWMSSGPPNPYPQGWAMRSMEQLAYAGAAGIGGFAVFRVIRELPRISRLTIALVAVSATVGAFPSINQFIQVDRCLDSGGRWSYEVLQCRH